MFILETWMPGYRRGKYQDAFDVMNSCRYTQDRSATIREAVDILQEASLACVVNGVLYIAPANTNNTHTHTPTHTHTHTHTHTQTHTRTLSYTHTASTLCTGGLSAARQDDNE